MQNRNISKICFDYIPCVMNEKQVNLAEKVHNAIRDSKTYQAARENSVDFVAIPKGDDAIDIFMTDQHLEKDVIKNRRVVKTPFRLVEVPSEFKHKVSRLLEKMNIYLKDAYNVEVK